MGHIKKAGKPHQYWAGTHGTRKSAFPLFHTRTHTGPILFLAQFYASHASHASQANVHAGFGSLRSVPDASRMRPGPKRAPPAGVVFDCPARARLRFSPRPTPGRACRLSLPPGVVLSCPGKLNFQLLPFPTPGRNGHCPRAVGAAIRRREISLTVPAKRARGFRRSPRRAETGTARGPWERRHAAGSCLILSRQNGPVVFAVPHAGPCVQAQPAL